MWKDCDVVVNILLVSTGYCAINVSLIALERNVGLYR
jgi:hypothetical protein